MDNFGLSTFLLEDEQGLSLRRLMCLFYAHFLEYIIVPKSLISYPSSTYSCLQCIVLGIYLFDKVRCTIFVFISFPCFVVFVGVLTCSWTWDIKRIKLGVKPEKFQAPDQGPLESLMIWHLSKCWKWRYKAANVSSFLLPTQQSQEHSKSEFVWRNGDQNTKQLPKSRENDDLPCEHSRSYDLRAALKIG